VCSSDLPEFKVCAVKIEKLPKDEKSACSSSAAVK
jgi:hypothetical protein